MKKNLAVFISGNGSNLNVFLNHKKQFNKIFVVSSKKEAYGLVRASEHNVESLVLGREVDWVELSRVLKNQTIDLIFLAGFMKILPSSFVEEWEGKLFNIHPSMLPKYKGLKAIDQALQAKDDIGATIHRVTREVDAGEILLQEKVLLSGEALGLKREQIIERVHKVEHALVKKWIEKFS